MKDLFLTIGRGNELNCLEHLTATIGHAVVVLLLDLLRRQVRRDESKCLETVAIHQQVHHWSFDVAKFLKFFWLGTEVVNTENAFVKKIAELAWGLFRNVDNVLGDFEARLGMKVFSHKREMALRIEIVNELHKSEHHSRFAIARRAIEPYPEFRDISCNGISNGIKVCFGRIVDFHLDATALNLDDIELRKQVKNLLRRQHDFKTWSRHRRVVARHQIPDELHIYLVSH